MSSPAVSVGNSLRNHVPPSRFNIAVSAGVFMKLCHFHFTASLPPCACDGRHGIGLRMSLVSFQSKELRSVGCSLADSHHGGCVLEKLGYAQLVKKFPVWCGPASSWSCSQESVNGLYLEREEPNSHTPTLFPQDYFNSISHLRLGLPSDLFASGCPPRIFYTL